MTDNTDDMPQPIGTLAIQTIAMPQSANWNGDIFGGWLVSQMDLAGAVTARKKARGRVATVAIDSMAFLRPVPVGAVVSCYTQLQDVGRSSMQILVEVWIREDAGTLSKVTEGHFTFVAIDDTGADPGGAEGLAEACRLVIAPPATLLRLGFGFL